MAKESYCWNQAKTNCVIDILAIVFGLVSALSGFVLWLILPSGSGWRRAGAVFWGLERHQWLSIHNLSSLVFVSLLVVHLLFHWNWLKNIPNIFKS